MGTPRHQRTIDQKNYNDVIDLFYEASLNHDQWPYVLKCLGTILRDADVSVGIVDVESGNELISLMSSKRDEHYHQLMKEQYGTPGTNPGLRFMISAPPGQFVSRESIQNDFDMEKSDFYRDVMRPYEFWHAATGPICRSLTTMFPLGALRRRSAGPFDEADLNFLRRLAPHLNRAMHVFWRLYEFNERLDLAASMLDCVPCAVVAVNTFGVIGTANQHAERILSENDGLIIRQGKLAATRPNESARLMTYFEQSAGQKGERHRLGNVISITRKFPRRALPVVITPLSPESRRMHRHFNVSVIFKDLDVVPRTQTDCLSRLYGFTPREFAVAVQLLQGRSPLEAAEVLRIQISTMRTHIQHLLHKTNTTRRSELVGLLLRSPSQW